jgi:hypothetical protein
VNADLQLFVREALARGFPRAAIRERLLGAGWHADEVEAALLAFAETDFPIPVPRRRPYLSAREAFLYLVLFATLYTSTFNAGAVLFELIEKWLPDPMRRYGPGFTREAIRNATAGLIIAFPIFLFVARIVGRSIAREPEKRGSKIRKWLTYITLFVAALVIIGDLTFLVSRLLSGELPPRVLLKALVVFAIAGTVFGYYLGDLRQDEREEGAPPARPSRLARVAVALTVVVIAAGLVFSGSPRRERLRQLDARRVDNLRSISNEVDAYARDFGNLPRSLDELFQRPRQPGRGPLRDPVTGRPYEYRTLDSLRYELCAEFATADSIAGSAGSYESGEPDAFWKHDAGRACFTVRVPPRSKQPR